MNNLEKVGNYLGTGIGIVLALLRRRILDGKPGVSSGSVVRRPKKGIKLQFPNSTQLPKWVTTTTQKISETQSLKSEFVKAEEHSSVVEHSSVG